MPHNTRAKILHICKVYLPVKGGIQKVVHSITFLSNQYSHQVLTSGEDGAVPQQELDNATVTRCRSYLEIASMPIAPALIPQIIKSAKKCSIICLHYPFPLADLALLMTFRLPPIVVYWHSNIIAQKKLKWLIYPLMYLTLSRATAIVVTSDRMVENSTLLRRFRAKIKIIPYGLAAVDQLPTSPEKTYFILVGRHVSYKGIDIAIRALQHVDSHLVLAGDGPLFEQHKLLAKTLAVSDKVTFNKNMCDRQLQQLIQGSTALIVPSVMPNEAFALVQLEAMRLKKPVINTSLTSTVPLVARDQKEGLTVEPNNVMALAKAMNQILADEKLATTLGNNGYQRFKQHFTEAKFKRSLDALFDELVASKS